MKSDLLGQVVCRSYHISLVLGQRLNKVPVEIETNSTYMFSRSPTIDWSSVLPASHFELVHSFCGPLSLSIQIHYGDEVCVSESPRFQLQWMGCSRFGELPGMFSECLRTAKVSILAKVASTNERREQRKRRRKRRTRRRRRSKLCLIPDRAAGTGLPMFLTRTARPRSLC